MLRLAKITEDGYDIIQGSAVDTDDKTVTGDVFSFSGYAIVGKSYGIEIHSSKDRIAANGEDETRITVIIRKTVKDDTDEATGAPAAEKSVTFEIKDQNGKIKSRKEKTNDNGIVSISFTADKPGYNIVNAKVKVSNELLQSSVIVYLGGEWPYFEDFEGDLGNEWTYYDIVMQDQDRKYERERSPSIKGSPNFQEKFLGPFTDHMVVLTLDNIPGHWRVIIEFDFIAIGPWQGGYSDKTWTEIRNDPDTEGYAFCHSFISLQDRPRLNDVSNSLGYNTTSLIYEDQSGDEIELERGDRILPVDDYVQNHYNDSIEIGITVDERGFGEESDVGQYWGIDNIYIRYYGVR